MRGVNEGNVLRGGQLDTKTTGGALVIIDFEDLAAEGWGPAIFGSVFGDER